MHLVPAAKIVTEGSNYMAYQDETSHVVLFLHKPYRRKVTSSCDSEKKPFERSLFLAFWHGKLHIFQVLAQLGIRSYYTISILGNPGVYSVARYSLPEKYPWERNERSALFCISDVPQQQSGQEKNLQLLKEFDMTLEYGPCIGITRMERWERADKFGLHPPQIVKDIISKKLNDEIYTEC
ncbi:hypothetical protein QZH41_006898 [Actinostola sp. cb2023]|nr:hypothetical protein QZH41_006898 [Actinostola sp. cb2023]